MEATKIEVEEIPHQKRMGGQTSGEDWLVCTESVYDEIKKTWTHKCGEELLAAEIAHPIRDGLFSMSGSGRCEYETVPYCPKCEEKPNYHGAPITLQ